MRRPPRSPAPFALDEPGEDPDGAQVDGTPAPEGEAEEDRTLAPAPLLVAQAEPGTHEEVVARTIRTRVAGGPSKDGAGDQAWVPGRQLVVAQSPLGRRSRPEGMDEDVGSLEEAVQLRSAVLGLQIDDDAALRAIPGEKAQ